MTIRLIVMELGRFKGSPGFLGFRGSGRFVAVPESTLAKWLFLFEKTSLKKCQPGMFAPASL
jgi:hypothetical protein